MDLQLTIAKLIGENGVSEVVNACAKHMRHLRNPANEEVRQSGIKIANVLDQCADYIDAIADGKEEKSIQTQDLAQQMKKFREIQEAMENAGHFRKRA